MDNNQAAQDEFRENGGVPRGRFLWRVLAVSLFFLAVGLGAMWLYFVFLAGGDTVGLETLEPPPPLLPAEQLISNRVKLFFASPEGLLAPEIRELPRADSTYDRVRQIVEALLQGPRSRRVRSQFPRKADLLGLYLTTGTVVLDLSSDWQSGMDGVVAELLRVYGLVNSILLNCPELQAVVILVEGRPVETLGGYVDVASPLVENLALIAPSGRSSASRS